MISGVALLHVDDIVLLENKGVELQDMLDAVQDYVVRWKMKFNGGNIMVMLVETGGKRLKWNIDGEELKVVEALRYLGLGVDGKI